MNEPGDPNRTVDDVPSAPADSLDAGLAAGFGKPGEVPRSGLGSSQRPLLLKEAEGESNHIVKPHSDAMPDKDEAGDRYQLFGEIARGGMGAVLRGRDVDLGRDLAVKVLLEKYKDRPEVARRFLEEAQIGGQLQHPGVVPVYDVGRFGDRPFFTMKLVKGQTLAAILGEREQPTDDRPRLLGIALKVSETLAYAHAKGVIHRDLKPANIMVGAFGEVQVMDWGLAKVLAEGGIADEERASRAHQVPEDVTTIRTARSTGSAGSFGTATEAGSLLGTPAYMPPEQATGDIAHLDRRADVFGLGAILCEILTGKPPYVGRSHEEVRRKSCNGDLADAYARLAGCVADAELVALTKACLSPEAIDRPKDAGEVAGAVERYLTGVEDRARRAELDRAAAAAEAREQRKRRQLQLALAVAVGLLLVGGGAVGWWQDRRAADERTRVARNADALAALVGRCEDALRADDAEAAGAALAEAEKRLPDGGGADLAGRLDRCRADLAVLHELNRVDQFKWTPSEGIGHPDNSLVAARFRAAFAGFGAEPGVIPPAEASGKITGSLVRDRLVGALDVWLTMVPAAEVRAVLRLTDPDPYRDAVRDAVLVKDVTKIRELAVRKEALAQPAAFAAALGQNRSLSTARRRALMVVALRSRPGSLSLLMELGFNSRFIPRDNVDEGLRWYQAAVSAHPWNATAHNNLGVVLSQMRDLDGAIACFREAIRLDQKYATAHANLVGFLNEKNDTRAIAAGQEAIRLCPNDARCHYSLGNCLLRKGDLVGAEACFRKAIQINSRFYEAHVNLGATLVQAGKPAEALRIALVAVEQNPGPANQPNNHRYNAACYALNCADGMGKNVPTAAERVSYRKQALDLLTAELALINKFKAVDRKHTHNNLQHWFVDPDLASVRGEAAINQLPLDEQAGWVKLWTEVRALRDATAPQESASPPRAVKPKS